MILCSFEKKVSYPNGSYQHTKCINEAQVLVTNDPCYGLCYTCAYQKLQAENKRLKKAIEAFGDNPAGFDWGVLGKIDELETENERLKQAIQEIKTIEDQWDNCIPECDVCYKVLEIVEQALNQK